MKISPPLAALVVLASLSLACSSSKTTGGSGNGNGNGAAGSADAGFVPLAASATTFSMTGGTIGPSSESFNCTYVTMPSTAGFITGGEHEYTPGSHHLLVYRTSLTSVPAGEASPSIGDCYAANATYMNTITGSVYAAQTPNGSFALPEGIGIPYTANEVLLFQVHYLNTGSTPLHPEIYVHLDTSPGPVTENAGVLLFYAPFIYVPQGGMGVASNRCPISQNITLLSQSSHYHARGVNYQAFIDTTSTTPATTPIYTSNNWESPPIQTQTIQVAAGSDIRYYCYYDNTLANATTGTLTGTQDFIQGQSALANEMCMFGGIYYPAMSTADEQCQNGDTYGTGTTSCTDTLTCLSGCNQSDDAGALGLDFNECTQKCFVQSCPGQTGAIIGMLNCLQSKCPTECASATSSSCATCVESNCLSEYTACSGASCGSVPAAP